MIFLNCDYNEGVHPKILERIVETNDSQQLGYGYDDYSENARRLIKKAIGRGDDVDVYLTVGGTPTNVLVLSHVLKPFEAIIAADSAHINTHEAGSVEARGHKILATPVKDGKLLASDVKKVVDDLRREPKGHVVEPRVVYISNPTELGTLYTEAELRELYAYCKSINLYLYMDGARLGYGLTAEDNDLDLPKISHLTDAFYIGCTKCGAICGEAVVLINDDFKENFFQSIKQAGQLLAKGRLLGTQLETLFTDDLYFKICKNGNDLALKVREFLKSKGVKFMVETSTNQQFPILKDEVVEKLKDDFTLDYTKRIDEESSVYRICTSWATKEENIDKLIEALDALL
ncbi:MAG: beta-eliminating lyase-related protein [Firmicutes bacterium]|nr:beta-eliminating lyase-related protein [Bacillota bacterium]